jgi:23S rRNA (guanosine2251-2'-O)-methyltransferase
MYLYGKRSIRERILVNPSSVQKLYVQEGIAKTDLVGLAKRNNIIVETLSLNRFQQLAKGAQAQGLIAETDKFRYQDFDELISPDDKLKPTLIFLDRINDPHNLGSILRSCACFGGFAVVLPRHESVEVTDAVLKVACGAENHIPVSLVVNLATAIDKAKRAGYWIGAAVVDEGENPRNISLNFPLGIIFGSEGEGIRPGLIKYIDYKLSLPMQGAKLSFNVAMAVSIFCYEVTNQNPKK